MEESPTKKSYAKAPDQEKPFPGEMAKDYTQSNIEAIRGASLRGRSAVNRTLGKTVSAPVISSQPSPLPMGSPPTRAPLHSRDNSLRELQPYGDLKAMQEMDGFDIEQMDFSTPHATPPVSPSKKRGRDEDERDEAVAMDEDSPCPSPTSSPSRGVMGNRSLGRAQTEPSIRFDASF